MLCRTQMRPPRFRAKNLSACTRPSTARVSSMHADTPWEMLPSRQRPSSAPRKWTRFRSSIPAGNVDRMRMFAKELVDLQRVVIFAISNPATAALQRETQTIPIIFVLVADPVGEGFVASLARRGGNHTGFIYTEAGWRTNGWSCSPRSRPALRGLPSCSIPRRWPVADILSALIRGRCPIAQGSADHSARSQRSPKRPIL
jgi:hypothetical protein